MVKRKGNPQRRDVVSEPSTSKFVNEYLDSIPLDELFGSRSDDEANQDALSLEPPNKRIDTSHSDIKQIKNQACFSVAVATSVIALDVESLVGKLGTINLARLSTPELLSDYKALSCLMYVSDEPGGSYLNYQWQHSDQDCSGCDFVKDKFMVGFHQRRFVLDGCLDSTFWRSFQKQTHFKLILEDPCPESGCLVVGVWLQKVALLVLDHPSQLIHNRTGQKEVRLIMQHLLGLPELGSSTERSSNLDFEEFFSAIKVIRESSSLAFGLSNTEVQHSNLIPSLRAYQADAIRWMVSRETLSPDNSKELHKLYIEVNFEDGQKVFYHRIGGMPQQEPQLPGGILADEMGLGKTIEVLGCILCHPRPQMKKCIKGWEKESVGKKTFKGNLAPLKNSKGPMFGTLAELTTIFECICGEIELDNEDQHSTVQCRKCLLWQHAHCVKYSRNRPLSHYYCPHCWVTMLPYPSRATIIVTPSTISQQWVDEIGRHLKPNTLRLLVYTGVRQMRFIDPATLADHDVVLVNYSTLRNELHYVDVPHRRSAEAHRLRHPKRFVALPSPLTAVEWWRVCLDEAQMVEGAYSRQSEMALRLPAVNRWCVTGTPLQRSMDDLYGMLQFLGLDPYCTKRWWLSCLLQPYCNGDKEPMLQELGRIMWRTAKRDVLDQIQIPAQTEETNWLSFTPIEEYFYRQQHVKCASQVEQQVARRVFDLDANLNRIDRDVFNRIMFPLLRIRQACCHPQLVRGQFVNIRKSTMTMEELLDSLIKKTKLECENDQRIVVFSLNGLAGIHIIENSWAEAANCYRQVLQSAAELRPMIKTDKLQRIHALHNLGELLEARHPGISPALRDADLRNDVKKLQDKYLTKFLNNVIEGRTVLNAAAEEVRDKSKAFKCETPWWSCMISHLRTSDLHDEMIAKIKNDLSSTSNDKMSNTFNNAHGLQFVLSIKLDELQKTHDDLFSAVQDLEDEPSELIVHSAAACHLRPTARRPLKCVYCQANDLFTKYETKLFSMKGSDRSVVQYDPKMHIPGERTWWAASETEKALRSLLAFGRRHVVERGWTDDGALHMELFDTLKKEFKALRVAWMRLQEQASALDELSMTTLRLRVRLPDEPKPNPPRPDVLEPAEVPVQQLKLNGDKIVAQNELQKRLGLLSYLQNLAKSDYGKRGGVNPELCPICQHKLGVQWSVLQCGHCFCFGCTHLLVTNNCTPNPLNRSVKCAVCRQPTVLGEISYCNTNCENSDADDIKVFGSHSTKVEAIVRKLLKIKLSDKSAKVLVFSTWVDVLEILANALRENNLIVCGIFGKSKSQEVLNRFKRDPSADVLLLPISSGGNGLNLIEATHVVLVEPILNRGSELQAIGRVHRIGQTKPTVVHRFLVRGTIEERIHGVMVTQYSNCSRNVNDNGLTPRHLLSLFSSKEIQD